MEKMCCTVRCSHTTCAICIESNVWWPHCKQHLVCVSAGWCVKCSAHCCEFYFNFSERTIWCHQHVSHLQLRLDFLVWQLCRGKEFLLSWYTWEEVYWLTLELPLVAFFSLSTCSHKYSHSKNVHINEHNCTSAVDISWSTHYELLSTFIYKMKLVNI